MNMPHFTHGQCTSLALAGLIALGSATAQAQVVTRRVTVNSNLEDLPAEVQTAIERLVEHRLTDLPLSAEPVKTAPASYLGVSVTPAPAALGRHLGLPEGIGLQVVAVDPEGPAAAALERDDILHRFGDQLLSHPDQLAALVRTFKKGERVSLAIIRTGQPRNVEVTLAEKELPSLDALRTRQTLRLTPGTSGDGIRVMTKRSDGARSITTVAGDAHTVTVTSDKNGKRSVRVTGRDGAAVFEGPITTDEDLAKVPAELRGSVDRVLEMEENRFPGILGATDPAPYDRAPPPEPAVTLNIQGLPLEAALDMLSRISGVPVEIRGGPLPEAIVTLEMVDTPFRQALDTLTRMAKLSYVILDGRVVITVGGR